MVCWCLPGSARRNVVGGALVGGVMCWFSGALARVSGSETVFQHRTTLFAPALATRRTQIRADLQVVQGRPGGNREPGGMGMRMADDADDTEGCGQEAKVAYR